MSIAPTARPTYGPETTLRDYFERCYRPLRLAGKSPNTVRLYHNTIEQFSRFLEREPTLGDLDDDIVTALLGWIVSTPATNSSGATARSPLTANKAKHQLCALWGYAARKRHVAAFPDVQPLPAYRRKPTAWTVEEFGRLLSAVDKHAGAGQGHGYRGNDCGGVPGRLWWTSLLLTLYDSGLRIHPALQLRLADWDARRQTLFVAAEFQKHRSDQLCPVSDQTAATIQASIAAVPGRALLWPRDFHIGTLYYRLERFLRLAGLPHGRRDKFHKLRRTSATLAELHVGPGAASAHLQHSSPRVTESYLDRSMLPQANVAAALPRPEAAVFDADSGPCPEPQVVRGRGPTDEPAEIRLPDVTPQQLTKRQREFLRFLVDFAAINGCSPTRREACQGMGWKSEASFDQTIAAVAKLGLVTRGHGWRNVTVTEAGREAAEGGATC